ncbi:MAG TPA: N-acetylmuramoyl-L-alanine amidase [Woeseiaceae bacterium]|nr:N-acetylmuramoyl-L-alanine amidase [Woeseiaceae bacterium]
MTDFFSTKRGLVRYGACFLPALYIVAGCAGSAPVRTPSENFDSRIRIVVIHHTTADFAESLNILTKSSDNPVSSHYLIPEPGDPSYKNKKLETYKLVPEADRAWHAGKSYWGGRTALNDQSIGIEIVNQTYCHNSTVPGPVANATGKAAAGTLDDAPRTNPIGHMEVSEIPGSICFYPDFPEPQISLLVALLADIKARYPEIEPVNYVGHSDIAPDRKIDPGPRFPWQYLYRLGYGAWFDDATVIRYFERFRLAPPPLTSVQRALNTYGYGIEATGRLDQQTADVLRAFQLHFRPASVTGKLSIETTAVLFALIEKYFPERLDDLLAAPGSATSPSHELH